MEFKVLGPLAVSHGGVAAQLGGTRRRRLLAALLAHANTVVPAGRLIEVLWGNDAPATAPRGLRHHMVRLGEALEAGVNGTAHPLVARPPGYLLRVDPRDLDAARFEQLVAEATTETTPPDKALARLEDALGLWRGPAFAEFAEDELVRDAALRLEELRLVAVEKRFELGLALDRHAELLGEIEAFVAEHPQRERARVLLMVAFNRSGRRPDALAVYQAFRREVSARPAPVVRPPGRDVPQSLVSARVGPDPEPARPRRGDRVGNLRLELNTLVGRADDVALALATLREHRVVTMTGVGGVGKTRLALRVAAQSQAEYPHGVWLCELAAVRDGWQVPDIVATTLGMQEPQGLSVTDGLVDFLRSRRALLVIDNCEHVLGAAARLVEALARGCRDVRVLATSREPLGIDGEHVLPVRPLAVPPPARRHDLDRFAAVPSVALFADRAAAMATFALSEHNIAAVSEICRRLDGLPLAIELAATRVRSMSVDEIAGRLGLRLEFLRRARRLGDERHWTLGSVVEWSYRLLDPTEQSVFDSLSVFAGSFTLEAAVAVARGAAADSADVVDKVTDLVDKSMLVADPGRTPARFTMLETLRIFGRDRLEKSGRTGSVRRAHATYHAELAEDSDAGLSGLDEVRWAERIDQALDDLRSAHGWGLANEPTMAIRISAALLRYTAAHGPSEVYVWADRTVAAVAGSAPPDPRLSTVFAVAAAGAARRGDLAGAAELARRGLRVVPERYDPLRRFPLWVLARVASFEDRLVDAMRLYAAVAKLARALATGTPTAIAWADYALGVAWQDRKPEQALAALERARAVARAGRNTYIPGVALGVSSALLSRHGQPRVAARLAAEVIDHWSHESHWAQQWTALRNVIDLLTRLGEHEAAATVYGAFTASRTAIPASGMDADVLDANVADITAQLGADRFAATTARGAALSDDDAVAFARAALERINSTEIGPAAGTGLPGG